MKKTVIFCLLFLTAGVAFQVRADTNNEPSERVAVPNHVLDIANDNTSRIRTQDLPTFLPSELTKQLLETTDVPIENHELIRILNESTMTSPKLALLFKASIYLRSWPLSYDSSESNVHWEYKLVNTNAVDNRGGTEVKKMTYSQTQQQRVSSRMSASIADAEEVKKMMLLKASEKTGLPLAFETVIGQGTKKNYQYNLAQNKVGYLHAYVPAVHEKGTVTYGEVYLTIKGGKRRLEVKNVVEQKIAAWLPVQDYLSFKYSTTNDPK